MEKKIVLAKVPYFFFWDSLRSIEDIEQDLMAAKELGATHLSISIVDSGWGSETSTEFSALCEREETDDEFQARLIEEKEKADYIARKELEELDRLKLKYETN